MGISIRAYARHRGVTDTAVHKAIRAGRITPEADGTIDADRADREWARNSDVPKAGTQAKAAKVAVPESGGDGPAALPTGGASLLQARTVNEVVNRTCVRICWSFGHPAHPGANHSKCVRRPPTVVDVCSLSSTSGR